MFGLILPSRPVLTQTSLLTISPTQFAFKFSSRPHFSHIVIFLLPGNELPIDTAAAVYIQLPGSAEFRLLGAIANEKQTAIFRVNGMAQQQQGNYGNGGATDGAEVIMDAEDTAVTALQMANGSAGQEDVTIGISIEPAAQVLTQVASLVRPTVTTSNAASPPPSSTALTLARRSSPAAPLPTKILAQRIIQNAFNFLASFAGGGAGGVSGGNEVVPLKSFQDWWIKFERRIDHDPGFLEREGND
ncbi:hypothetical protein MMC14_004530 [Varicellaria rhodocarpa]|nr:hypothetical protein [Varicellaria rhodocarpa]